MVQVCVVAVGVGGEEGVECFDDVVEGGAFVGVWVESLFDEGVDGGWDCFVFEFGVFGVAGGSFVKVG